MLEEGMTKDTIHGDLAWFWDHGLLTKGTVDAGYGEDD